MNPECGRRVSSRDKIGDRLAGPISDGAGQSGEGVGFEPTLGLPPKRITQPPTNRPLRRDPSPHAWSFNTRWARSCT
jgi:hypothetical protein